MTRRCCIVDSPAASGPPDHIFGIRYSHSYSVGKIGSVFVMTKNLALTITIGLLAMADTYITATVFTVPAWVTFIAWASYFVLGGAEAAA